jgi:N-acetylglutamate synthase-like GNAT family acetyltransferase
MRIRLATVADIPKLLELIPNSVRGLSQNFYTPAQIESAIKHVFGPDTRLIEDGTYFLVEEGSDLVGCGGWSRRATLYGGDQMKADVDPLLNPMSDPARIRAFFIHPAWARRGVGTAILNQCVAAARVAGFREMELVATLPGEQLYSKLGFKPIERLETTLPDGVEITFVRMRATIPEHLNQP